MRELTKIDIKLLDALKNGEEKSISLGRSPVQSIGIALTLADHQLVNLNGAVDWHGWGITITQKGLDLLGTKC